MLPYGNVFDKQFFPTLVNNDLAYFDSAASTQTHAWVLNAMQRYYCEYRSNTHRASYEISDRATQAVEDSRLSVANLLNVDAGQIAFNSGATQGLNCVAQWCRHYPVVIVSNLEHNANLVPWLTQGRSINDGSLVIFDMPRHDTSSIYNLIEKHSGRAIISITAASNVTGEQTPYGLISKIARHYSMPMCLDATQIMSYESLDLQELPGITWAVFSGHKMYGPTGVGVVYSRDGFDHLDPPFWGGGNVQHVNVYEGFSAVSGPHKMEAGTVNAAGIIGMGAAAELIQYATHDHIQELHLSLCHHLKFHGIEDFEDLEPIGLGNYLGGYGFGYKTIAFRSIKYSPADIADLLAQQNIAVRSGRMCAHDYVNSLSNHGVLRVSLAPYNTVDDCKKLISGLGAALRCLN